MNKKLIIGLIVTVVAIAIGFLVVRAAPEIQRRGEMRKCLNEAMSQIEARPIECVRIRREIRTGQRLCPNCNTFHNDDWPHTEE